MALAVETYKSREVVHLKDLRNVNKKFLRKEVLAFTSQQALAENRVQAQQSPPNLASRMVFDRSTVIPLDPRQSQRLAKVNPATTVISGFRHTIQFFYTANADLYDAVANAFNMLQAMTPRSSNRHSVNSYYFWLSDLLEPGRNQKVTHLGAVYRWLAQATNDSVAVHILGPLTEYRRKVIYKDSNVRPAAGSRKFGAPPRTGAEDRLTTSADGKVKTRVRPTKRGARIQFQIQRAIHEIVKNRMRRQFRDIYFGYRFVRSREALRLYNSPNWRPTGENIHIPRLFIRIKSPARFKKQGRIR